MASRKYNWPIDDLNGGNVGRHSGMGDRVYLFPSTVPEQGSIPALDPSSLAPRTSAVAKVWNAKKSAIIIAVLNQRMRERNPKQRRIRQNIDGALIIRNAF